MAYVDVCEQTFDTMESYEHEAIEIKGQRNDIQRYGLDNSFLDCWQQDIKSQ